MTHIGARIKRYRKLRDLTQEFVAQQLDLSVSGYEQIEQSGMDVSLSKLQKIADLLEVSLSQLLGEKVPLINFLNQYNEHNNHNTGIVINHFPEEERQLYKDLLATKNALIKHQEALLKAQDALIVELKKK